MALGSRVTSPIASTSANQGGHDPERGIVAVVKALAGDIKISHSVFALPFALLAACMARPTDASRAQFGWQILLIVGCMVLARTVAMLSNRLADREIDARNPRTANRALPGGRVRVRDVAVTIAMTSVGFVGLCSVFYLAFGNVWPVALAVPVLAWISAYPFTKRVTWMCHVYLGSSLAISPLAAALAIDSAALSQPALWWLSLNVLCWVAGFDVIYALQDVDVDRAEGLYSMPSRLGVRAALWLSRALHLVAAVSLGMVAFSDPRFGALWLIGVGLAVVLLIVEHVVTAGGGTGRIQLAFFTLNGVISILMGTFGIISIVLA